MGVRFLPRSAVVLWASVSIVMMAWNAASGQDKPVAALGRVAAIGDVTPPDLSPLHGPDENG